MSFECSTSTVPWVGLQFVIVEFPDHTHFSEERNTIYLYFFANYNM